MYADRQIEDHLASFPEETRDSLAYVIKAGGGIDDCVAAFRDPPPKWVVEFLQDLLSMRGANQTTVA